MHARRHGGSRQRARGGGAAGGSAGARARRPRRSRPRALGAANPERIVWGSDWPHTPGPELYDPDRHRETPLRDIDTGGLLALLRRWLDDDALVHRVPVDNPARLYGFE
ncbi:MAG: amidohydrolase family protein [Pseudolabrys sp.]